MEYRRSPHLARFSKMVIYGQEWINVPKSVFLFYLHFTYKHLVNEAFHREHHT